MWEFLHSDKFQRQLKRFGKKHGATLEALLENLATVHETVQISDSPQNIVRLGKVRNEGRGLYAVDQRGAPFKLPEARLYFYLELETCMIHLIAIGFKKSQKHDILWGHDYIHKLEREKPDGRSV